MRRTGSSYPAPPLAIGVTVQLGPERMASLIVVAVVDRTNTTCGAPLGSSARLGCEAYWPAIVSMVKSPVAVSVAYDSPNVVASTKAIWRRPVPSSTADGK